MKNEHFKVIWVVHLDRCYHTSSGSSVAQTENTIQNILLEEMECPEEKQKEIREGIQLFIDKYDSLWY